MTVTDDFPEGHASLTDGSTTIPFIFTDGKGEKNERAFQARPYPRTALKTTQGESKYSDLEEPYFAIPQDDFTGGRGNEDFENDTSRYFDGYYVDTTKESGVVLGGLPVYSTISTDEEIAMPGSVEWQALYSGTTYIARSFVANANFTGRYWKGLFKYVGSPDGLKYEVWSDSGGSPNAKLGGGIAATSDAGIVSTTLQFPFSEALTSGTTYWMVALDQGTPDATNHWLVGCDSGITGKKSTAGSSWSSLSNGLYFHVAEDSGERTHLFFEYKSAFYAITQPEAGGNSKLYINGDAGVADDNSGDKTWLQDASKSGTWVADEWIGNKVLITKGPGSEEEQPWRNITDNTTTALEVSPDWNITHTTATEYVILGSDDWRSLDADLGAYITDVVVAGDYIWMARGGASTDTGIYWRRYYATGGTWTMEEEDTTNTLISDKILNVKHSNEGEIIYSSTSNHTKNGVSIYKGKVPKSAISADDWLFYPVYEFATDIPWNSQTIASVTQQTEAAGYTQISIAGGHTTGLAAVMNLDSPLDMEQGQALVAEIYSTVALDANDYRFIYDDVEDMGKYWSAVKVFKADYAYNRPPSKVYFVVDFDGATPTYTALPKVIDQIAGSVETISVTVDDLICVGYSIPFNSFSVDIGGTPNAVADRTLTAFYSNGDGETDLSATDGTKTADNGTYKTLAQDGNVTWTIPEDWVTTFIDGVEAYWVVCHFSGDLTPSIVINDINITVSEAATMTELYDDLTNTYDGDSTTDTNLTLGTEDYLYVGYGTPFNSIGVDIGTANDIASVLTAQYFDGGKWTSITITDGTDVSGDTLKKTASIGYISFTLPSDWEANTVNSTETYWIRLDVSNALSTVFSIEEITVTRQKNVLVALPAIPVSTWTTVMLTYSNTAFQPDLSSIKSIGLNVSVDKGATVFSIRKLWLANIAVDSRDEAAFSMPSDSRITGLQAYAGNVDDPILNPWIFTTDAVYEMQTQNDDQIVKIPIEELGALSSSENGLGHCVNGTYLYFNLGEKIERYFNRTLDDIGPDRDEGLPDDRPGIPKSLASYPGRIYAGIDAGVSGTSSALALDGTAWSEVYRAINTNERIRNIFIQSIPGTNVDKLWVSTNNDVGNVPISLNPYNETDYNFAPEGTLITSWIYANLLDVVKKWKSLKLFTENTTANRYIVADYQVDNETTWTEIGTFNTPPVQERDIASTFPQAKRIRYRLRFITNDVTESPRLKAIVTEGVAFVPVKTSYSWTFAIKKDTENVDLLGGFDDAMTSLVQYNQLVTWANAGTQLTLAHHSTLYDGKTVFLDPVSVSPIKVVDNQDIENHVAQLTCKEY